MFPLVRRGRIFVAERTHPCSKILRYNEAGDQKRRSNPSGGKVRSWTDHWCRSASIETPPSRRGWPDRESGTAAVMDPEPPATGARRFVPEGRLSLGRLASAATNCRVALLWRGASQVVFGEGSRTAELMLVGEQPGDR